MASQALSFPLLGGSITLEEALDQEEDMLLDLSYPDSRIDFFVSIYSHRDDIAQLVSDNLGLGRCHQCRLGEVREWIHGSFNVCIPVYVELTKRVMIRFPLPYKLGESVCPGNADEKLRCEAATTRMISCFLAFGDLGLLGVRLYAIYTRASLTWKLTMIAYSSPDLKTCLCRRG